MSSKIQSERSSASSSPLPRPPARSLIVSKVSLAKDEAWLFNDFSQNYPGVKKVSRNHDHDGNELSSIRIDFDSDKVVTKILNENAIFIKDKAHYIRPYWPLVCYRCENEGHVAAECPQLSLPEWRLAKLIQEQKKLVLYQQDICRMINLCFFRFSNFESLINGFENRWTARLEKLKTPKTADVSVVLPVANDLTMVCQQLNQQNLQMQQQLSQIANRIQNMPIKVNN
jgi:hypothetical protein